MKKTILLLVATVFFFCMTSPLMAQDTKAGGVKSLEKRIKQLEEAIDRKVESDKWFDRIQFSGVIEVEAGYEKIDYDDPAQEDESSSDIDLAAVELGVDAKIAEHVDGHFLLKYEDDEVFVDEGFILLTGSEAIPVYFMAGRITVPFGNYDSYFLTDPNTLVLGETNDGAALLGYRFGEDMVDIVIGAYNSDVQKSGSDDYINSFIAGLAVNPLEGLSLGLSYVSNLAGSGGLSEVVTGPENLDSYVGGWSAFASYEFLERFKLIGEYLAAIDDFQMGELYDAEETKKRTPAAWNVEFGVAIIDSLEMAVRYGGSADGGADFLPENQYGIVLNWGFFDSTNLAIEYMRGEFENDVQKTDVVTAQVAVEF